MHFLLQTSSWFLMVFWDGFWVTFKKEISKFLQGSGQLSAAAAGYSHMLCAHTCQCAGTLVFLGSHPFSYCHFSKSDSASTVCVLSVAVPTNLSGRGCPQFDSLLCSRVWIRIKLKLLPKPLCCLHYVCMDLIAIHFECLVLQIVILTAILQQEGNAFLSFWEIRCWHVKAERFAHGLWEVFWSLVSCPCFKASGHREHWQHLYLRRQLCVLHMLAARKSVLEKITFSLGGVRLKRESPVL